jgi:hypothetical protein
MPTLQTRMANERPWHFVHLCSQIWRHLAAIVGEHQARALFGLTNVVVMFGGSKTTSVDVQLTVRVMPAARRRSMSAVPIAEAGVRIPKRSGSWSSAAQSALSPIITAVAA